jgi:hypothetical protein
MLQFVLRSLRITQNNVSAMQNFRVLNLVVIKEPLSFKMLIQNANGTSNISKQIQLPFTMAYTINRGPRFYESLKLSYETFFVTERNVKS